jgi:hypothetical protein
MYTDHKYAVNVGDVGVGFTSLPKEGVLRIFALKIRQFRPGFNQPT